MRQPNDAALSRPFYGPTCRRLAECWAAYAEAVTGRRYGVRVVSETEACTYPLEV